MLESMIEIITIESVVAITAAIPLVEVRGAIPVGVGLGMSPWHALGIALIGSMIPVPFILFFIRPVFKMMLKSEKLEHIVHGLTKKTLHKSDKIKKYGFWGLLIFVAIPLPGTGVWSGALASSLLDIRFKVAFPAILIGNVIAGLIITALSYGAFKAIT